MAVIWMIDKKFSGELTIENFKNFILELEKENLLNLSQDDKKQMVAKIMREYEEAKKSGNQ
jgi:hypothetical protein